MSMFTFNPPGLSVEPQTLRNSSSSTSGRPSSASRARPRANSSGGGGGGHHVSTFGTALRNPATSSSSNSNNQVVVTSTAAAASSSSHLQPGPHNQHGHPIVASQERLIQNLKSQVDILQKELSHSKHGSNNNNSGGGGGNNYHNINLPAEGTPATHAVVSLSRGNSASRNSPDRQNENNNNYDNNLITFKPGSMGSNPPPNSPPGLPGEVLLLRQRHADLERNFTSTVGNLRRQLEEAHNLLLENDVIDPRSLSAPKLVKRNPNDARQKIQADMREREHSLEVVELKKEVERLKSVVNVKDSELASIHKEKDAMVQELVAAKDAGRTAVSEAQIFRKQLDELQSQFRGEQEQRHQLEDKLGSWQLQRAQQQTTAEQKQNEEYENKIRQLNAQLSVAKCEAESAKMGEQKWRAEIEGIAQQNAELARAAEVSRDHAASTDTRLKDTQGKLEDCEAQREFLQLTVDRMRVEESQISARNAQLDNILRAERESTRELERRYNRALEDQDSLMRNLRQRDADQERRDIEDTKMRAQAKYAIDNSDAIRRENEQLRHQLADVTRRYETTMEMQQTEKSIQHAVHQMEQAKFEMSGILQRQMRVAQDVANCVSSLPTKSKVGGSNQNTNNNSTAASSSSSSSSSSATPLSFGSSSSSPVSAAAAGGGGGMEVPHQSPALREAAALLNSNTTTSSSSSSSPSNRRSPNAHN